MCSKACSQAVKSSQDRRDEPACAGHGHRHRLGTQVATENGGCVLSSQAWQYGTGKSATLVIAVLAENFETAMRRLRDLAVEVQRETSSGQDVTAEYVDLEARLRNLEATRDRIRAFLDEAQTVDEALRVNE